MIVVTGIDVNGKGEFDRTALISAARNGHAKVVNALLQHKGQSLFLPLILTTVFVIRQTFSIYASSHIIKYIDLHGYVCDTIYNY